MILRALFFHNNEELREKAFSDSLLGGFTEQLANAQFSQHEERQADNYGVAFLEAEGYDKTAAVSALKKLAILAQQHTFLSSHPEPEARAKRIRNNSGTDDHESIIDTLFQYAKTILYTLFNLAYSIINWILSLIN